MTKQELARKRNYFKFQLLGMLKPVDLAALTVDEISILEEIAILQKILIKNFDGNSRLRGLNVADKCWCGKVAKYTPIGYPEFYLGTTVCKKHLNYNE